jgi:hypothetical protein
VCPVSVRASPAPPCPKSPPPPSCRRPRCRNGTGSTQRWTCGCAGAAAVAPSSAMPPPPRGASPLARVVLVLQEPHQQLALARGGVPQQNDLSAPTTTTTTTARARESSGCALAAPSAWASPSGQRGGCPPPRPPPFGSLPSPRAAGQRAPGHRRLHRPQRHLQAGGVGDVWARHAAPPRPCDTPAAKTAPQRPCGGLMYGGDTATRAGLSSGRETDGHEQGTHLKPWRVRAPLRTRPRRRCATRGLQTADRKTAIRFDREIAAEAANQAVGDATAAHTGQGFRLTALRLRMVRL